MLGKQFVLDNIIVQVVAKIVCAGRSSMAVKYPEEAYLGPLNIKLGLWFWLENIENNTDTIFVVFSDNALVCIRCITLYHTTLLCTGFSGLVVLEEYGLRIKHWRVFPKQKLLNLNKLDVGVSFGFIFRRFLVIGLLGVHFRGDWLIIQAVLWILSSCSSRFFILGLIYSLPLIVAWFTHWAQRFSTVGLGHLGPTVCFLPNSLKFGFCYLLVQLLTCCLQLSPRRSNSCTHFGPLFRITKPIILLHSRWEKTFAIVCRGVLMCGLCRNSCGMSCFLIELRIKPALTWALWDITWFVRVIDLQVLIIRTAVGQAVGPLSFGCRLALSCKICAGIRFLDHRRQLDFLTVQIIWTISLVSSVSVVGLYFRI